ncbi:chromosome segregation protein SMC [Fusicatenibacter faecihominis]|uniref:Chromosome partition protein Smc n=1 Tax=Fusicatenibacter faecihominis TaxID=2881276 RepID=A0AAE3J5P2_9FIRM|nr:chromosome segregation protein SMC [Fusicatenibacter faecihominis]MCC2188850.1 chromosome segregation protein SMC [Fusicatenibacter faecihominis]
MYLKSIEVQGFKSFANKILFEFHNGITGIVGPNGSGKSNVGDAVRWVLGEQSAKSLRGASMQDVIFSGTENRKPMGFASVSITMDNSDHKLPIEFDEVTVTRRVYRSGESEYRINGSACRLKDINELFYDTGIGKEGYSIIGQGQIDKILSGKPEERRELFDEAVGIVKFKRRKAAAQKKLEDERQNLVRVNDILSELTRQLTPLEKQAETAKIYLKKRDELKVLDVNMFLLEMEESRTELAALEEKLAISERDLKENSQKYESIRIEYDRLEEKIGGLDGQIDSERARNNENQLKRQQLAGQMEVLREQIRSVETSRKNQLERLETIEKDLTERKKELEASRLELNGLKEERKQAQEEEEDISVENDAIEASISHLNREIEGDKSEIIRILNQRASTKGKIQRYDTMMEQNQIRRAEVSQRLLRLRSEENEQEDSLKELQEKYETVSEKIEDLTEESRTYEEAVEKIRRELVRQNQQAEQGQTAFHREASRLESLKNITERYDGYGNSIRRCMEQKSREPGLLGVVADLIKVEKAYEVAIETALGGSIQNIVTSDEDTAKRMIDFLKKNKFGRATFLPLTSVGLRGGFTDNGALKEPGVIGLASTLVQADQQYEGLVRYLLGRVVVADTIDHAVALARKYRYSLRIVTLEGELLSPGGSMTGGAFKNSSNLLGRRREIEELEESVKLLKKDLDDLNQAIDENRSKRNALRDKIAALAEKLQKEYLVQNTAKMEISQMESRRDETASGYHHLKDEAVEIETQMAEIKEEKHRIQEELDASVKQEQELNDRIEKNQKALKEEQANLTEQKQRFENVHLKLAGFLQKEDFLKQNTSRIEREVRTLNEEKVSVQKKMEDGEKETLEKEENLKKIQETIDSGADVQKEAEEKIRVLTEEKNACMVTQKGFFTEREALTEQKSLLDKENFRLSARQEKLVESRDARINDIWEQYELTPGSAREMKREEYQEMNQLKKAVLDLKNEIRSLGSVNVNAIEEFKEISERHSFLKSQHDDLVESEKALLGVIDDLDAGMRRQFEENFVKIQTEFDKAFRQLFGGGHGKLELVEGEDILEAGVRIIAQPPGKKLQNMILLSGGEKALTAIALLFAIQNLKPSPFCLLDEIEAALDESNVARYANYLHKLTKNTQFIIITHRRGTMAAADRLYGITMQEKGVSALVSVNLIEDDLDE